MATARGICNTLVLLFADHAQDDADHQQDHADDDEHGAGVSGTAAHDAGELGLQAVVLHKTVTGAADTGDDQNDTQDKHMDTPFSLYSLFQFPLRREKIIWAQGPDGNYYTQVRRKVNRKP